MLVIGFILIVLGAIRLVSVVLMRWWFDRWVAAQSGVPGNDIYYGYYISTWYIPFGILLLVVGLICIAYGLLRLRPARSSKS
jgi:hypothetical protein